MFSFNQYNLFPLFSLSCLWCFGLFASKDVCIILLSICWCCYERTRCMLLQKRVVRTKLDIMLSLLAATSFTFNSRLILTENIFLCQVYYRSFNHIIWCGHQKVEMTLIATPGVTSVLIQRWNDVLCLLGNSVKHVNIMICVLFVYLCGYFIVFCFVLSCNTKGDQRTCTKRKH